MRFFDIHTHILPGVDDGSPDMETSLEMLRISYDEGCRDVIMTPHYMLGRNSYSYDEIEEKYRELVNKAKTDGGFKDMNFYLGNEILYEEGIVTKLREGDIHTMNGTKYILVEYNIRTPFSEILHSIDEFTQARFRPIIAHVERYNSLEGKPERLDELIDRGCLLQMNISSVEDGFLNENKRWCRKLLKRGYITLLGTDTHNTDSRAPYVQEYAKWIIKKCGEEEAGWMMYEAAEKIVAGEYID